MSVTSLLPSSVSVSVLDARRRAEVDASVSTDRVSSGSSLGSLRLTRRGRVVLGALATILVAGLLAWVAVLSAPKALASDAADGREQFNYAVVQPGESLWSLATQLDASADPRDLVAEIIQLNQLQGSDVQVGQPIAVPLRYSDNPAVVSADELGA